MPRDDDKSLGDEATLQGGKRSPADERSLGDRSTFRGGDGSSLSDLREFADLPDHDMEIIDLRSRYKIQASLGRGGMGEVLLATDTRLDRSVAIKRIRGDAGSSKAAVARFLTEAKAVAALNHHNIVQIHDYGRDEEGPFLIMEYVPGGTLLDRCKKSPIGLEEAIDLACQLCDGLGSAHDAGIIHRDIKPANILLTNNGIPKLTDFGLAKAESRDQTMTLAGAVLGTLDFMPPEQRQDASLVDARSDLWSLAATLYQMVTGESPKIIRLKKVPLQIRDLIDKALEENKGDRYATASKLKDALQQSLSGGTDTSTQLEQGVCPGCGTRNEASRKFCRNASCAASLETTCLSCSATNRLWDEVCGNCGSIQSDLLHQRHEEMTTQKTEAETCLARHDYARAHELARKLGDELDPRLQQLKSWSDDFCEQVDSTRLAEIGKLQHAIAEALSHENAHDYRSGIRAIKQLPSASLAASDVPGAVSARDTLRRLQEKHDRTVALETKIKGRIKSRNMAGLLASVESLLELLPERSDLLKLQRQLQQRESDLEKAKTKALMQAADAIKQHDYETAISVIETLKLAKSDGDFDQLYSVAFMRKTQSDELYREIMDASTETFSTRLLAAVEEYLALRKHDVDIWQLHAQLVTKKAKILAAEEAQKKQKREEAAALLAKQRARKLQIILGSSIAAAFLLFLSVMFYLRAQWIAMDISTALGRGDHAAALQLDPTNTEALSMQKAADLQQAISQGDYETALQLEPSNAQALSMKKAAIQQALSDGDSTLALQLDPGNTEALVMKRLADSQQALRDGDYALALQLDPGNAEALVMKNAANSQQALSDGDYALALQLDPGNAEALVMKKKADSQQALSDGNYDLALQLDPDNAEALVMMQNAKDLVTALESRDYQKALKLDPKNAEALTMKRGADLLQALETGDHASALRLDPDNAEALSMKAADLQKALSDGDYIAALQIDPTNAEAQGEILKMPLVKNSIGMTLKFLPPGVFQRGIFQTREVTLTKPFMIGIHEVTQEQYERVTGDNPSNWIEGANNPVKLQWVTAVGFCRKLSALPSEKAAGRVYRLPTEAEWEYACRAGTTTNYSFGTDRWKLQEYAWTNLNSNGTTHPVGQKRANPWGLHDMYGNVHEWCSDWYEDYPEGSVTNPMGSPTGTYRVFRGGSYRDSYAATDSNKRNFGRQSATYTRKEVGFRVVCELDGG